MQKPFMATLYNDAEELTRGIQAWTKINFFNLEEIDVCIQLASILIT